MTPSLGSTNPTPASTVPSPGGFPSRAESQLTRMVLLAVMSVSVFTLVCG
jgi:hypothetical protein